MSSSSLTKKTTIQTMLLRSVMGAPGARLASVILCYFLSVCATSVVRFQGMRMFGDIGGCSPCQALCNGGVVACSFHNINMLCTGSVSMSNHPVMLVSKSCRKMI